MQFGSGDTQDYALSPFAGTRAYHPAAHYFPPVDSTSFPAGTATGVQQLPTPVGTPTPVTPQLPVAAPVPAPTTNQSPGASPTGSTDDILSFLKSLPGYQFQYQQGLNALYGNAYAGGLGNSGATIKAAEDYGQNYAQNYFQQYLNNVGNAASQGLSATNALSGVGTNLAGAGAATQANLGNQISNGVMANGSALGSAALANGAANANMFNTIGTGIGQAAGLAASNGLFGSSFGNIGNTPVNFNNVSLPKGTF